MKPADRDPASKPDSAQDDVPNAGETPEMPETEGVDARNDPEKLKENRERLGVDEEHKTPEMKKQHRGSFP